MLKNNMYKAFDVKVDEASRRYLDLYDVSVEKKGMRCEKVPINEGFYYPDDLEHGIMTLRNEGYRSVLDLGLVSYEIPADSVIANYTLALFGSRMVPLEYVYYAEIKDSMSYLLGAIIYVDVKTGKEYVIRTNNFGVETPELVESLENRGYIHICDSSLWGHFDKLNTPFARELKK